ncbi:MULTISPECIES: DUF4202 domain-containing protein [unclassified Arcicella]|uniref:DUF4202 domain-containing protein n=2 Tax=Arcicella TaxID=217140 RepID=UPI00285A7A92|nr:MULTISPECIES: DUF4202 domain-containing protein [unclassified Arcicella]MDR6559937.1 hypothetical protein [Arcicella sp. BE51]MDR6810456.1 hypothetical protein [Arcicella sp. BE140]MDR6821806.1 hypothetical protein [Arcicella sp. BE139]
MMEKLATAFQKFDEYNKADDNIFVWEGVEYPQEYFLALQLYQWVLKLDPNATEALLLASRSQHIGRWEIARETYPDGRVGYLTWRKDLSFFHAKKAKEILTEVGYEEEEIAKVERIILKQRIKTDPEVQTMENALCLVFLQFQYEDFHPKYAPEKVINILKKSLLKMDAHGHQFALKLTYSPQGLAYIQEALKLLAE